MDIQKLQAAYRAKLTEARTLTDQFKDKPEDMTQAVMDQANGLLGQADEIKARLGLAQQLAGAVYTYDVADDAHLVEHG